MAYGLGYAGKGQQVDESDNGYVEHNRTQWITVRASSNENQDGHRLETLCKELH